MTVAVSPAAARVEQLRGLLVRGRALIFDVDGTLAETEELHRQAFNEAFARAGMDWHWGRTVYKDLLRVAGGKERIRAFDQMRKSPRPLPAATSPTFTASRPDASRTCLPGRAVRFGQACRP